MSTSAELDESVRCPECNSCDVAHYSWPDDPQSRIFRMTHPDTRVCRDCRCVWWTDEARSSHSTWEDEAA